jgi:heptosyltransferase-2
MNPSNLAALNPKKILFVKIHAIGDTLMATPSFAAVRRKFPNSEITLLTGTSSRGLIKDNPDLDYLLYFDETILFQKKIFKIISTVMKIRKKKYDLAIILHYSSVMHLFAFMFRTKYRLGFTTDGTSPFLTHSYKWNLSSDVWAGDMFLKILEYLDIHETDPTMKVAISQDDQKFAQQYFAGCQLKPSKPHIGFFPGGGKNSRDTVLAKRWPSEKYATLINRLVEKYEANITIFAAKNDSDVVDHVLTQVNYPVINSTGKFNLKQLTAAFNEIQLLITNDSAPLHIAISQQTPVIALFGPSNHQVLVKNNPKVYIIQSDKDCSPCYANSKFPDCEENDCMDYISVDDVMHQIESNKLL